jgi:predicted enzyme related to lactoylglutathione lyase
MAAGVVHWEISSRNAKTLQDFYSNLFGWLINADNPMQYGLVDTGLKLGINGGIFQGNEKQPPGVVIYAQVEDIQSYLDKAVSLGGKVILPITEIPNMVTYALITDIDGNMIGLIKGSQSVPQEPKKKPVRKQKKAKKVARTKPKARKKARR